MEKNSLEKRMDELSKQLEKFNEYIVPMRKEFEHLLQDCKITQDKTARIKYLKRIHTLLGKRADKISDILPLLRFIIDNSDVAISIYIEEMGFINDSAKILGEAAGIDIPSDLFEHEPWI